MATGEVSATRQRIKVKVSGDAMSASVVLHKPADGESAITAEEVVAALQKENVEYGIDNDAIEKAVSQGIFVKPVKVAQGLLPERGDPAQFEYHFETELNRTPKEGDDGRIDYREVSVLQNTHEGELLVTKTPPTEGKPGKNVHGKEVKGPRGKDAQINKGANTELSEDGLKLVATASGTILFLRGKVAVNDVTSIPGDVDFNVGNIDCAGSVRIGGDVKTGFSIKVDGNLEISGNVEDATIEVTGQVLVKGGFFGDGSGSIKAGGDVTIKYAEGQTITADGDVVVGGEIIQCQVLAGGSVEVKSRRGKIVGGQVRARRDIRAAILGSDAATITVLQAGYIKELYDEHDGVEREIQRITEDIPRVKEGLVALYRIQMEGGLTEEQAEALEKLQQYQKDTPENLKNLKRRLVQLEQSMRDIDNACIIAENIIYPGVRACFGVVYREMIDERKRCRLTLDDGMVGVSALLD